MSSLRSERGACTVVLLIIIVACVLLYTCTREKAATDKIISTAEEQAKRPTTAAEVVKSLVWFAIVSVVCYSGYKIYTAALQHKNERHLLKEEAEARERLRQEMHEQDRKYAKSADKNDGGDKTA